MNRIQSTKIFEKLQQQLTKHFSKNRIEKLNLPATLTEDYKQELQQWLLIAQFHYLVLNTRRALLDFQSSVVKSKSYTGKKITNSWAITLKSLLELNYSIKTIEKTFNKIWINNNIADLFQYKFWLLSAMKFITYKNQIKFTGKKNLKISPKSINLLKHIFIIEPDDEDEEDGRKVSKQNLENVDPLAGLITSLENINEKNTLLGDGSALLDRINSKQTVDNFLQKFIN